jgi:hypothetical protein
MKIVAGLPLGLALMASRAAAQTESLPTRVARIDFACNICMSQEQ